MVVIVSYTRLLWEPMGETQMRTAVPTAMMMMVMLMMIVVVIIMMSMIWISYSAPPASVQAGAISSK